MECNFKKRVYFRLAHVTCPSNSLLRWRLRGGPIRGSLLALLALAYIWMVMLGAQSLAQGVAQPLIKRSVSTYRRLWSLFREGLRFLAQVIQRQTVCLGPVFLPDKRSL